MVASQWLGEATLMALGRLRASRSGAGVEGADVQGWVAHVEEGPAAVLGVGLCSRAVRLGIAEAGASGEAGTGSRWRC